MTPPDSLLRAIIANNSAADAHRILTEQGYTVSMERCRTTRSRLRHEGAAEAPPRKPAVGRPTIYGDPANDAKRGSKALLDALERHYAYVAFTRGCSVPAARLVLNYSPAQIARMAA